MNICGTFAFVGYYIGVEELWEEENVKLGCEGCKGGALKQGDSFGRTITEACKTFICWCLSVFKNELLGTFAFVGYYRGVE